MILKMSDAAGGMESRRIAPDGLGFFQKAVGVGFEVSGDDKKADVFQFVGTGLVAVVAGVDSWEFLFELGADGGICD